MDICIFMKSCKESLLRLFGDNLLFLGLQGSYARGEAKETSDIDLVAILQKCGKEELLKYRTYIDSLPEKDIICGFIACLDVLRSWDGADRAQLVLDTKPVYKNLAELCPSITQDDIRRAILQGSCAIYHASSHNIRHARNWSVLPELYKSARFTIRMKNYFHTGIYISAFRDLASVVDEGEKTILETNYPNTEDEAFILLEWASDTIKEIGTNCSESLRK